MSTLSGVIPALLSPFDREGTIDQKLLEKQISYFANAGVQGLFACGTTAEGAYLSTAERRQILSAVKEGLKGDQVACLAILVPSTKQALEEIDALSDLEPDYVSVPTPYYYPMNQGAVRDHYLRLADASKAPIIIYNIPQNTHNQITPETILSLKDHENIVGVKDSSGNFMAYLHGLLESGAKLAWLQGEDRMDVAAYAVGAPGIVTGLGNVSVEPYVSMYRAIGAGDLERAKAEQRKINAMAEIISDLDGDVIAAIKAGAAVFGRVTPNMRMPTTTATEAQLSKVRERLNRLGML